MTLIQTVCEKLGYNPQVNFVTARCRNGKIFVGFTLGKPHEIRELAKRARAAGFELSGKFKKLIEKV